jgi:hypothetical protein
MENHASRAVKLYDALILSLVTAGLGVQITIFKNLASSLFIPTNYLE